MKRKLLLKWLTLDLVPAYLTKEKLKFSAELQATWHQKSWAKSSTQDLLLIFGHLEFFSSLFYAVNFRLKAKMIRSYTRIFAQKNFKFQTMFLLGLKSFCWKYFKKIRNVVRQQKKYLETLGLICQIKN